MMYFTPWLVLHSGSFVSHLKGMSKVRVSLPEDIKTATTPYTQKDTRVCIWIYIYLIDKGMATHFMGKSLVYSSRGCIVRCNFSDYTCICL